MNVVETDGGLQCSFQSLRPTLPVSSPNVVLNSPDQHERQQPQSQ